MNNTQLTLEVIWKIAENFFFNPTAAGTIIFLIGSGWFIAKRDLSKDK
jgi:hypothetical protein